MGLPSANDYAKYAATTWSTARWGALLTASATHQLVRTTGRRSRDALGRSRAVARESLIPALATARRRFSAAVAARLREPGVSMLGLSACVGLCVALGAFAPTEIVRWAAACTVCAAIVLREHSRERATDGLRVRVTALEERITQAQRRAYVELVDVDLLDEDALVSARRRSIALASEAAEELDVRRAFAFEPVEGAPAGRSI